MNADFLRKDEVTFELKRFEYVKADVHYETNKLLVVMNAKDAWRLARSIMRAVPEEFQG
jgi:hypothetical protein